MTDEEYQEINTTINIFGKNFKPQKVEKRKQRLEELISKFQVLSLGGGEAIEAAKILGKLTLMGNMIYFRDGLNAGIAISNGIKKVLTRNANHFNRIEEIKVIPY
ncbi:MAG: type II toxin-antitoxin system VapC family toxin [Candidatus Hodarchaeales archaeon]